MRGSFARQRLHGLLTAQAFGALGVFVASIADMVIAGNFVGVDALAGIAAVLPVVIGTQFIARFIACGSGYVFAKCQGALDGEQARRTVGTALMTAAAFGCLVLAVTFWGRDAYFDFMGLSGAVREQASCYWRWIFVYYAFYPLAQTMWRLVVADGEMVTTAIAGLLAPLLTIALSVTFTLLLGTASGVALGVLAGMLTADLVTMLHVFRPSNAVIPRWQFSWRGLREIFAYSLTDSAAKLCQCALAAVVSRLVVASSSVALLPVIGMLVFVQQLSDGLDHISDAYMPIAEMYLGERNLPRLRELARHSLFLSLVVGLVLLLAVELLAPQVVSLYGIPPGPVFDHSVVALRYSALSLPFLSALLFFSSHYLVMDRIGLSLATTVLMGFLLPAGCALGCCWCWGLDALWWGLSLGCLLTMIGLIGYSWSCERRQSPLLIPPDRLPVCNLTFVSETAKIIEARDVLARFLQAYGVAAAQVSQVMLLAEECAMAVADGCRCSRRMLIEASLIVDSAAVTLVLRDTGSICDLTDGDAKITSLRRFVIAGLVGSYENRRYLNTIGCNRMVFVIDRR